MYINRVVAFFKINTISAGLLKILVAFNSVKQ
jgi:hypothetical protein